MKSGYIDPSIRAGSPRERELFAQIIRRGLTLRRREGNPQVFLLVGPGISILTTSLVGIRLSDTAPVIE